MSDAEGHPEPVPVAAFTDSGEAEVAQAKLAAYGIGSFVVDHIEGGLIPVEDGSIALVVRPEDADDAKAVLAPVDEEDLAAQAEAAGEAAGDLPPDDA